MSVTTTVSNDNMNGVNNLIDMTSNVDFVNFNDIDNVLIDSSTLNKPFFSIGNDSNTDDDSNKTNNFTNSFINDSSPFSFELTNTNDTPVLEVDTCTMCDLLKNKITKEQLFKALTNGVFNVSKKDTLKDYSTLYASYKNEDVNTILTYLAQVKKDMSTLEKLLFPYSSENENEFAIRLIKHDNYLVQLADSLFTLMRNAEDLRRAASSLRNKLIDLPQYSRARANEYYSESKLISLLRDAMND